MVTLQDISIQLMKPAKDLANWKFPLSQILEEYYALLEEPCRINFGEAALVLQNSTNVYVRRIECLLSETEVLRQTFLGYEEEEMKKSMSKGKKVFKKTYVDFENFVIIDLEKDVGKHIDKKNQLQAQKKVKLLSHRFTQLENGVMQLYIPIQMYDVKGEVIGKKYDFRCNQTINTCGMLVDELTPADFTRAPSSRLQKERNSMSLYSEPKTPTTGTSGYHSVALQNEDESIRDDFEDDHDHDHDDCLTNELDVVEKENTMNNNTENSFVENATLNESLGKSQDAVETCDPSSKDANATKESNRGTEHDKQLDNILKDAQPNEKKEGSMQKRGNQTTKICSVSSVDDINEGDWNPMPLIRGLKHAFTDSSSVLKLPPYISFLETKFGSKKRKCTPELRKPECLTKLVLRDTELFRKNDDALQTKQKFRHLQKEELEDFMKNFDECFNGAEKENNNCRFESVTNVVSDASDFRASETQDSIVENGIEDVEAEAEAEAEAEVEAEAEAEAEADADVTSKTPSPIESPACQNSLDMIASSPNSYHNRCESSVSEMNLFYSLPDYQTLIEDKMKELHRESNVASELDQTVAQWHASLQPKLSEIEVRPAFRINDYASQIVGEMRALQQKRINFDSVVRDKPAFEVARYFLASLQLANTYSVEINPESSGNGMELSLLEGERS